MPPLLIGSLVLLYFLGVGGVYLVAGYLEATADEVLPFAVIWPILVPFGLFCAVWIYCAKLFFALGTRLKLKKYRPYGKT